MSDSILLYGQVKAIRKAQRESAEAVRLLGLRLGDVLADLKLQGDAHMNATTQQLNDLAAKFDTATNEVAKDLADLRAQITGGISAEDAAPLVAKLAATEARLTALGADPENPVPQPTPTPAPGPVPEPERIPAPSPEPPAEQA
jgi:outer membrane biosynthesis protein TonB